MWNISIPDILFSLPFSFPRSLFWDLYTNTSQGIDGTCVKFSVELGGFVVDPALQLPPNVKDLVSQLCEMGWLFNKVL